jgi:hypothetical protein
MPAPRAAASVAEPSDAWLAASWRAATEEHGASDATPGALRWQLPSCALRLQLRSLTTSDVAPGRAPVGTELLLELDATPREGVLELRVASGSSASIHGDNHSQRPIDPKSWLPAHVETDGALWQEAPGPSTLWAAHGAIPPLALAFPRLPATTATGALARWVIRSYPERVTSAAERARAADPSAQTAPPGHAQSVDLRLDGWQQVGAERAAILSGSWRDDDLRFDPIESHRVARWRGRFAVSERGRLLHAALVANSWQRFSQRGAGETDKHGTAELELRLVDACDGVTLPRMTGTRSLWDADAGASSNCLSTFPFTESERFPAKNSGLFGSISRF